MWFQHVVWGQVHKHSENEIKLGGFLRIPDLEMRRVAVPSFILRLYYIHVGSGIDTIVAVFELSILVKQGK